MASILDMLLNGGGGTGKDFIATLLKGKQAPAAQAQQSEIPANMMQMLAQGQGERPNPIADYAGQTMQSVAQTPNFARAVQGGENDVSRSHRGMSGLADLFLKKKADEEAAAAQAAQAERIQGSVPSLFDPLEAQKMDPMQAAVTASIKAMIQSGDPEAMKEGFKQLGNLQSKGSEWYSPTANIKDVAAVVGGRQQPKFQELLEKVVNRPVGGTTVNIGGEKLPPPAPGFMWNKEGTMQNFIPGGPHDPKMKVPTTEEQKAAGRQNMSNVISRQYNKLMSEGFDPTKVSDTEIGLQDVIDSGGIMELPGLGKVGKAYANKNISPQYKRYIQTQNSWLENFGRDQSGGAITHEEYPQWRRNLFPQPGDDEATVTQKAEQRQAYEEQLGVRGGNVNANANANAKQQAKPSSPPPKPAIGAIEDGYTYLGGDPSKKENWKPNPQQAKPAQQPQPKPRPVVGTVEGGYTYTGGDPSKKENWRLN